MRIGFFQFKPEFARKTRNVEYIQKALAGTESDLIVLPELSTSGYLFTSRDEVEEAAETLDGPSVGVLQGTAREMGIHIILGLPEWTEEGIYNSAVLIRPDGSVGIYRKVHLFNEEKLYFKAGNLGFPVFEIKGVRVGLLVCFDHMFPEAARTLALQGVQIICHPSNLVLPEYGQLTTRVRSMENRLYWILANRWGTEARGGKKLSYTGLQPDYGTGRQDPGPGAC
ncbi:unnamed protein product [marine sediment metagenome]|uniref:CN hydrolase domain-containing protein n=1 Tax=marine sediment metagenome TaxID=412755 RepID=X1E0Z3_9ZZZZ